MRDWEEIEELIVSDHYILDGHEVRSPESFEEWLEWSRRARRDDLKRVAYDKCDEATVSTVFLSLDHQHLPWGGPPLVFETMVFWHGHELDNECYRYSTWAEAEQGHAKMVARVLAAQCTP